MGILEVACDGYDAAKRAYDHGAGRIELCAALEIGGLTPTLQTLRRCKKDFPGLQVMAMLRNRAGGFCYTAEEFKTLLQDLDDLIEAGADGIVYGFLKEDATLDLPRMKAVAKCVLEADREAVLHRAFDACKAPYEALEQAIDMGITRVLSSGGRPTAYEGAETLRHYIEAVKGQLQILPGVGISSSNAEYILEVTGATQLHASCKTYFDDPTTTGRADYHIPGAPRPNAIQTVDGEEVLHLAALLANV